MSLLPECFASHLPGTLAEIEAVVAVVETSASVEKAAETLRPDIELPGAVRWTRRRVMWVRLALTTLIGLMPERFRGCQASLASFRAALGQGDVLVRLRGIASAHVAQLSTPIGLRHRRGRGREAKTAVQQSMGRDPPE